MSPTPFLTQPTVGLLVLDLAKRLRTIPAYQLSENAFLASLVQQIVTEAKPKTVDERVIMVVLREVNRGFAMQKEGRRIVEELAAPCRAALPRKRR